jgi:segregation and condensation protein A
MISSLEALHLRLEEFEGPLPLLLHLIERNELEVTRVSVASVADQFIALVASLGSTDLSTTGEFVAAAARLLLIKSRAVLSRSDVTPGDSSEHDDADLLARQIAEYARFKSIASLLAMRLEGAELTRPRPAIIRTAAPALGPPEVRLELLARAGRRLLARERPTEPIVESEVWPDVPYASLRAEMLGEVRRLRETTFSVLCKNAWHPLVVITLFLALLDAVRVQQVHMHQEDAFGPIAVTLPEIEAASA